jgi:hypothetical protein
MYKILYILLTLSFSLAQINIWSDINTYRDLYKGHDKVFNEFQIQTSFFNLFDKDKYSHYLEVSPESFIHLNENLNIYFKHNIISDDNYFALDSIPQSFYEYKRYGGLKSYTEQAYFNYNFTFGALQLGRFFDKIGEAELNGLILDDHDYHDGYRLKLKYKSLTFTNRYFALSPVRINTSITRHFHQHGLKWDINDNWSVEAHETSIYDGKNLSPPFCISKPFFRISCESDK